jgi:hypothetical protein
MLSVRFLDVVKRISTVSSNAEREAMWILEASCGLRQHHLRSTLSKNDDLAAVLNNRQLATFLANVDDRVDKRKPLQVCTLLLCMHSIVFNPCILSYPAPQFTTLSTSALTHTSATYT